MEQGFLCGEHGETTNIFCETCDKLICLECLGPHSKKNCKSPISLFYYAKEQILPKYKAELDIFETHKESFEKSISDFVTSSMKVKQQLIQLKSITMKLLEIIEEIEKLTNTPDEDSSYYDTIRESFTEKYENMKKTTNNKDIKYIMKNRGEHDLEEIIGIHSKQKELIELIRNSIDNLLKSKEIEQITKGFQELYSSHTTLIKDQSNKVTSKFHYGLIHPQDDFKLL